ncbi:quinone-dependent dihydroorotate dehydrogenase [bacterium]|nr:quinone-dependent dihydroorotate dehydrogenase [bacterium]
MIQDFAARALRLLPAEAAHNLTIRLAEAGLGVPKAVPDDPRLAVTLPRSGLRLPNPIGLAAGFDKDARAFKAMLRFGFGFVECGTVTPRPQAGNPKPRLFRLPEHRAVLNRMGFNNGGLDGFVTRLPDAAATGGVVGANVGANKDSVDRAADYVSGVEAVWRWCSYITINISSPNTPGLRGLQDKSALEELLGRIGEARGGLAAKWGPRPVFLKVAPDLDDLAIEDVATVVLTSGAIEGLIVSNTTVSRPDALGERWAMEAGGLSGAPLMTLSTEVLAAFASRVAGRLDLIAAGGVSSIADVRAKFAAGAQAVQIYSALVYQGPGLVRRLKRELLEGE